MHLWKVGGYKEILYKVCCSLPILQLMTFSISLCVTFFRQQDCAVCFTGDTCKNMIMLIMRSDSYVLFIEREEKYLSIFCTITE